jgi:formylglycine-generating enzyme required for sulfatase activity
MGTRAAVKLPRLDRIGRRVLVAVTAVLAALAVAAGGVPITTPSHTWRHIDGKHWQIVGPSGEDPAATDAREGNRGTCAPGMVDIKGSYRKTEGEGDLLQRNTCKKWINKDFPERCAEFDKDAWQKALEKVPAVPMHFCMDRFEYPNRKGEYPIILMSHPEASGLCAAQGKRLCTEIEWTFACEGDEALPYPYGYTRDDDACVVDRTWRQFFGAFQRGNPEREAILELDYLWQGLPSGSKPKCKSPFGVYDMTGNIDEWTTSSYGGRASILKGGYWGPVRTRCRPSTRAHGEEHAFYQQGVRGCANTP